MPPKYIASNNETLYVEAGSAQDDAIGSWQSPSKDPVRPILPSNNTSTADRQDNPAGETSCIEDTDSHGEDPRSAEESSIPTAPESKDISHAQLVDEVHKFYSDLIVAENECKEVDEQNLFAATERDLRIELKDKDMQALMELHKKLLYKYHGFFILSQHPEAELALSRLANKYKMIARLWHHGIYDFLEVFRSHLPSSRYYLYSFIDFAFSILWSLHEKVPALELAWAECLGDLAYNRLVIEERSNAIKIAWGNTAKYWYLRVARSHPGSGRLYHHLAMLPNGDFHQLYYYTKSLTSMKPFTEGRACHSPLLERGRSATVCLQSGCIDCVLLSIHSDLYAKQQVTKEVKGDLELCTKGETLESCNLLTKAFQQGGTYVAMISIALILECCQDWSLLRYHFAKAQIERQALIDSTQDPTEVRTLNDQQDYVKEFEARSVLGDKFAPSEELQLLSKWNFDLLSKVLQWEIDQSAGKKNLREIKNIYQFILVEYCFIYRTTRVPAALRVIEGVLPKVVMCDSLNVMIERLNGAVYLVEGLEHCEMEGQLWYDDPIANEVPDEWTGVLRDNLDLLSWIVYYGRHMPGLIEYDETTWTFSPKHPA